MEIRYKYVLYIGIASVLALLVFSFMKLKRKKDLFSYGKKVANSFYTSNEGYFKRKMLRFKIYTVGIFFFALIGIMSSFFMVSRPYTVEIANKNEYSRDIIFCIDISYSVDYLNANIISKMKETVKQLKGERIGIVIFNSSPVLLTPLTDDYEFVLEELDTVEEALNARMSVYDVDSKGILRSYNYNNAPENWDYLYSFISSGTLIGSDDRGSSLIGDGLASAAFDFSEDEKDKDRTKVIILSTDNLLNGEPFVPLDKAADICINNDITVYGIGTKEMEPENMQEMKAAVEKTGGAFFLEEESGNFDAIVNEIEKKSKNLIVNGTYLKQNDYLTIPFVIILISFVGMHILVKITRR